MPLVAFERLPWSVVGFEDVADVRRPIVALGKVFFGFSASRDESGNAVNEEQNRLHPKGNPKELSSDSILEKRTVYGGNHHYGTDDR